MTHVARSRLPFRGALALTALLVLILAGCAQSPATTRFGDEEVQVETGEIQVVQPVVPGGPLLGTVEVWIAEHGILFWTPRLDAAGTYDFEIENRGNARHDFTITRARSIQQIPTRSDRALLQDIDVIARSKILDPGERVTVRANLDESGSYVVLSTLDTDFGRGMATVLAVGATTPARPVPAPTPRPDNRATVAVYLADFAAFLHNREVNAGVVTLQVQNIGPSPHDLVVVRWRGDTTALPVDEEGDVMLEGLMVVGQLPPIPVGESAVLEVEMEQDMAYVVFSSMPGDYAAGMAAQIVPR